MFTAHVGMLLVVVATAKVQIFKQITTCCVVCCWQSCCCCYRKGTNFQANHNRLLFLVVLCLLLLLPQRYKFSSKSQLPSTSSHIHSVVVATAKVQIFKQITTRLQVVLLLVWLLLLPQRYKFSSKSQPRRGRMRSCSCCCCYRKGTNFQANHNTWRPHRLSSWLLLLPQRYKFSSKSQQQVYRVYPD